MIFFISSVFNLENILTSQMIVLHILKWLLDSGIGGMAIVKAKKKKPQKTKRSAGGGDVCVHAHMLGFLHSPKYVKAA